MPRWENCEKIHAGCGGRVKWVEAINTPGVGYYGKCTHCGNNTLPLEKIIPIEYAKVEAGVLWEETKIYELAELEWDDQQSWEQNQERLKQEIEDLL